MSDNDEEELRKALDKSLDKYINAIRAERRAVDQTDSTKVDQGDSRKSDQVDKEILGTRDLEELTGTKANTWRYWASIGEGPASFKLGRRRVWKKSVVLEWLAEQENSARRSIQAHQRT
jgi:prophage regulatory protein